MTPRCPAGQDYEHHVEPYNMRMDILLHRMKGVWILCLTIWILSCTVWRTYECRRGISVAPYKCCVMPHERRIRSTNLHIEDDRTRFYENPKNVLERMNIVYVWKGLYRLLHLATFISDLCGFLLSCPTGGGQLKGCHCTGKATSYVQKHFFKS